MRKRGVSKMYVDKELALETVEQFNNGEIELRELEDILSWYDGDPVELF
jgi:hypothetical protein